MDQFSKQNYNLEERTAKFGESIITYCKIIIQDSITKPIISQLIRSGTSIGANYCEANNASSTRDFRNKIFICKKEAQETLHWLRMLASCLPNEKEKIRKLWKEAKELTLIFQTIANSLDRKSN
ncbi:MAG: four helix bundle protein [Patescibacteria group bacterium]|nr:four helix bundle protein [Patescibacteria group bacterium]